MASKKNQELKEEVKKPDEDWMTKKWRPMMALMYMTCCLMDFAIFPIMFTIVQFWETQAANDAFRQWVPITLQGGGLFHVAMGAVLGVSAYGRTQEKVAGASNVSTSVQTGFSTPSLSQPTPTFSSGGFNSPTSGPAPTYSPGFSAQSFNTSAVETTTEFSMSPVPQTAPGGRRPVTPRFDL